MLWEGKYSYASLDEAKKDLDAGLLEILSEIYGEEFLACSCLSTQQSNSAAVVEIVQNRFSFRHKLEEIFNQLNESKSRG